MKLTCRVFQNKNNGQLSLALPKKILLKKLKMDKLPIVKSKLRIELKEDLI